MSSLVYTLGGMRRKGGMVTIEIVQPPALGLGVACGSCRIFMEQAGVPVELGEEDYPKEMREMAQGLRRWVDEMLRAYPGQIRIRLIQGLSVLGLWRQIRHRLRPLPGFLVDGRWAVAGWEPEKVESIIRARIAGLQA